MSNDKTELLPCPFCSSKEVKISQDGGSDERCGYNFTYVASCNGCKARIIVGSGHDENGWCNEGASSVKDRCIEHWNTRPAPPQPDHSAQEPIGWANANDLVNDGYSHTFTVRSEQPANGYVDGGKCVPVYAQPLDTVQGEAQVNWQAVAKEQMGIIDAQKQRLATAEQLLHKYYLRADLCIYHSEEVKAFLNASANPEGGDA